MTATTADIPLTEIIQEGSFSPEVFVPPAGAGLAVQWDKELGYTVPFAYESEFTVLPWDVNDHVRITPGILSIDLKGNVQVACEIRNWQVVAFDASVSSELAASIRARVEFLAQDDLLSETTTLVAVPLGHAVAFIGLVPVWLELQLGVDLGVEVSAEAAVTFEFGVDTFSESEFRLDWSHAGLDATVNFDMDVVPVPLDIGFQVSADTFLYLKPRLSALLYSLAGVSADYRRGPNLEAKYEVGDPQCAFTLYDKFSINAGLMVVGVDDGDLPNQVLIQEKRVVDTWYWPEIAEQIPVFTQHPADATAAAGSTVVLSASATGNPEPDYQWFQNGLGIPFKSQPTLSITASPQSAGNYYVSAMNRLGRVTSNPATVAVSSPIPPPPAGMMLIPAGNFQMGNALSGTGDEYPDELPVHTVYVSAFYMDRYEVTKAQWDEVANWASSHGYDIAAASGSGKGADHPVHYVSWYECVKWCNARSEKEGQTPAYYTSAAQTTVCRTGAVVEVQNDWVRWDTGYRLPTEAEWEKAARGGASGRRFPWSDTDTIQHTRANYDSSSLYSYDTSATRGFHSDYDEGGYPYTSPVGRFAPNGYGLYDMADNVWEWCWDWYGGGYYGSSPGSDPRGPASGSHRVGRGGGWLDRAYVCRVAGRGYGTPDYADHTVGFRVVLPPGPSIAPRLSWPLPFNDPYTAHCVAVMDHDPATGRVVAYNGEVGDLDPVIDQGVTGYAKSDASPFVLDLLGGYEDHQPATSEHTHLFYDNHRGYDYPAVVGAEIRAAADGRMFAATDQTTPNAGIWRNPSAAPRFANVDYSWATYHTFYIIHAGGLSTWYLHANQLSTTIQQSITTQGYADVTRGQVVGYTGDKGATGSFHLHFGVREATGTTSGGSVTSELVDPYGSSDTEFSGVLWELPPPPPVPHGMVQIPTGTNAGTDPDFGAYSLTVASFYMDRYEVTKAQWDEVKNWNGGNGYSYEHVGSGKAPNHPVHTVSWYDCVKWCNARSQQDGRVPVYYTDASQTQVYKSGQVLEPYVKASANGYRLPTDVQWEYAARGGVASRRFPWGDSDNIQHARANYDSSSSFSYDTSPTRGYHPTYNDNVYPYTSPVGSFAPNGYGLYDMAGNVWEWCYDWYPGYTGSGRVSRGGDWNGSAYGCRVGIRIILYPNVANFYFGFRAVLPAQ